MKDNERAQILSGYRRTLSTSSARASSGCLLGRIEKVGESNRMAAKRRAWALKESDRHRQERKSHWTAHVQGRGVIRGEFIYTIWLNRQTCCWTWCQIFRLSIGLCVLFSLINCYNIWVFKLVRRTFVRTFETTAAFELYSFSTKIIILAVNIS